MSSRAWTVASDEDAMTGFLLAQDDLPTDPDALLGVFVVLARREWGTLYDPEKLEVSAKPRGYRIAADGERMLPARKLADSHWWVIDGLDDAEVKAAWWEATRP